MTTAVQHRRGTTSEHSSFTGLVGEVTIDTTKDTAVIHDGSLAGGYPLAKENLANVTPTGLTAITGADTASDDKFFIFDQSASALKSITRAELNNAIEQDALANVAITGGTINGTSVGATTPSTGSFTTLAASGAVTLNGGAANGVAYLNGSKVLTTGSALTFNGTNFYTTGNIYGGTGNANANIIAYSNVANGGAGFSQFLFGNTNSETRGFLSYSHAAEAILFGTSGTEQMRLTSTGLGIGTSSPATKLVVSNAGALGIEFDPASGGMQVYNRSTSAYGTMNLWANTLYFRTGVSPAINMALDASGNLGIGTSSPAGKVHAVNTYTNTSDATIIAAGNIPGINLRSTGGARMSVFSNYATADSTSFLTSTGSANPSTEVLRFDHSNGNLYVPTGNLGIGTSSPGYKLDVRGASGVGVQIYETSTGNNNRLIVTQQAIVSTYNSTYSAGDGAHAWQIGNTEQMRLTSTGLGIGTSSPLSKLTVAANMASAGSEQIYITGTANTQQLRIGYNTTSNYGVIQAVQIGTGYRDLVINPDGGNLGLGVTPSAWSGIAAAMQLADYGTIASKGTSLWTGTNFYYAAGEKYVGTGAATRYAQEAGAHKWLTAPSGTAGNAISFTQAMTLDASGNLLVGQTAVYLQNSNSFSYDKSAAAYFTENHASGSSSGTYYHLYGYNATAIGSITQNGTTGVLFNTTSDQRLKENIQDADSASALIDSLQVRQFDWKSDGTHQRYGFVAQELVTVAPEAVHQPEDPEEMMGVDYSKLVPMLVKEIQSLRARVAALEAA